MATAKPIKIEQSVEDGIKATVMALRENLMMYYKGTCIDRLVGQTNVEMRPERQAATYQYMREINQGRDKHWLAVSGYGLFMLEKQPDTLTINNTALYKSPQFRAIREGILDFMGRYLRGIALVEVGTKRMGKRDDSDIVTLTKIRKANSSQVEYTARIGRTLYNVMEDGSIRLQGVGTRPPTEVEEFIRPRAATIASSEWNAVTTSVWGMDMPF